MAGQIIFFEKNRLDLSFDSVVLTASEGDDFTDLLRNRSLNSGWATTNSVDANNTTLICDMTDPTQVNNIILNGHNFKSYKIENWNGSTWVPFTPAIDITGNTATTARHEFSDGIISKFKITIRGTMVANEDKFMREILAVQKIGQLNGWLIIKDPTVSRSRKEQIMLSGKSSIRENVGNFTTKLQCPYLKDDTDLTILEKIHESNEGFHLWLSGGIESQFSSRRQGYRLLDLPLMKCKSEWRPEWYKGIYNTGIKVDVELKEVVD